ALAGHHGPEPHRAEEEDEAPQDRAQDREQPPLAGLELLEAFAQGHRPPSLSGFDEPAPAAGLPDGDADADAEPSGSGVVFFFLSSHLSSSSSTYFCFPSLNWAVREMCTSLKQRYSFMPLAMVSASPTVGTVPWMMTLPRCTSRSMTSWTTSFGTA